MAADDVKDELHSAIAARRELGNEMEPAVVDAFVERIERRLADRAHESERALRRKRESSEGDGARIDGDFGPAVRLRRDLHPPSWRYLVCVALVLIAVISSRS